MVMIFFFFANSASQLILDALSPGIDDNVFYAFVQYIDGSFMFLGEFFSERVHSYKSIIRDHTHFTVPNTWETFRMKNIEKSSRVIQWMVGNARDL